MRLIQCLTTLILRLLGTLFVHAITAAEPIKLRVGVEQNPPLSYFDTSRYPVGLMVCLLSHLTKKNGRQLKYVSYTWNDCLDQLSRGEIDLMATIVYPSGRGLKYCIASAGIGFSGRLILG